MTQGEPRVTLTLHFDKKMKVWVLARGGYLVPQLTAVDFLLVDRNVPSALEALEVIPCRPDLDADKWWLQHLNRPTPILNPILCATEGRWRTQPTFEQFKEELKNARAILRRTLPEAQVLEHPQEKLHAVYELSASQAQRMKREAQFLVALCPKLASRTRGGAEAWLEAQILQEADRLAVSRQSLCCIAALSTLYEKTDGAEPLIGRGVLKPKIKYSENDAYNALSDLHALEFLAAGSNLPGPAVGFCTRDKYLAAFWVCLNIQSGSWKGTTFSASFAPKTEIFPRLAEEGFLSLLKRIKEET